MTVEELKALVGRFVRQRQWEQLCLAFANRADIDLAGAVRAKLARNRRRYPVRRFRGRFGPDDPGPRADPATRRGGRAG